MPKTALYVNKKWNCNALQITIMITKTNVRWMFTFSWFCLIYIGWVNGSLDLLVCWTCCYKLWNLITWQQISSIEINFCLMYDVSGAVYMKWDISPRWDVSSELDTFHPAFTRKKCPTWVRYFSSQLACILIIK